MSTELQVMDAPKVEITPDQVELIKRTVATGATNDELKLFFFDCNRIGVHPLDKLLYCTIRTDKNGKRKYTPITSIDLFRIRADSTGEFLGCDRPIWTGKAGEKGSYVEVCAKRLKHGHVAEHWGKAIWDEFCPPAGQDHMWRKMPTVMLEKCAEAQALRKGFPKELHGIYVKEELDQAKDEPQSYSKAMLSAFPPGEELTGLLVKVEPKQGSEPAKAFIQTLDGIMGHEILDSYPEYQKLVGCEVVYRYGKNGKWKPIEEMKLKEIKATVEQVEGPLTMSQTGLSSAKKEAGNPPPPPKPQAKPEHDRALVLSVERVEKPGKKPYTRFELGFPDGTSKFAEYWGTEADIGGDLKDFKDLEGIDIFFKMDSREFKGKTYYTIHDVFEESTYAAAMAQREESA